MADTSVGAIHYDLDIDDSKFKSKLQNASNDVNNFGFNLEKAEGASKAFAAGLAAIGIAAIAFGIKSVQAYTQSEDVLSALNAGLKNTGENVAVVSKRLQEQATALQQVTRFSDEQILSADAMLTTFQLQGSTIEKLNPVLLDMAEGMRDVNGQTIGLDGAAKLLGKVMGNAEGGIDGMATALKKQGVVMTEAQKQIFATGTEVERLNTLTEIMTFNFGGRSLAAGKTFTGMMTILGNNVNDVMEIIGKGIVDRLKPMTKAFDDWMKSMGGANGVASFLMGILEKLAPFIPMIAFAMVGGLIPAFYALGVAIGTSVPFLIPFIAAGVAVGAMVTLVVNALGGWNNTMELLGRAWTQFIMLFEQFIKPALMTLWEAVSVNLVPALMQLWNVLSPLLLPVLQFLGTVLIGVVVVALRAVIEVLILVINWITMWVNIINTGINAVVGLFTFLKNTVGKTVSTLLADIVAWFTALPENVSSAISGLTDAITKPFKQAWDFIQPLLQKIKDGMNYALNPTAKHSPSLVDKITGGVDEIITQYARLSQLGITGINAGVSGLDVASSNNQAVSIYVDKVSSMQDVSAIGREMGFRLGIQPTK